MLYNHVVIHILETATRNERAFEFLFPLHMLCFITRNTIRSNTNKYEIPPSPVTEKSNVQKFYRDNDFAKTNYVILI